MNDHQRFVGEFVSYDSAARFKLPKDAKVKVVDGGFIITELPPEKNPVEELTDEIEHEGLAECRSDAREIAEWVLYNFDRKGEYPDFVIDAEGDRWNRCPDGTYSYTNDYDEHYYNWSLDRIRNEIGLMGE